MVGEVHGYVPLPCGVIRLRELLLNAIKVSLKLPSLLASNIVSLVRFSLSLSFSFI